MATIGSYESNEQPSAKELWGGGLAGKGIQLTMCCELVDGRAKGGRRPQNLTIIDGPGAPLMINMSPDEMENLT
eukprot:1342989-Amorphochlora_amoeboformis.AAC.1